MYESERANIENAREKYQVSLATSKIMVFPVFIIVELKSSNIKHAIFTCPEDLKNEKSSFHQNLIDYRSNWISLK